MEEQVRTKRTRRKRKKTLCVNDNTFRQSAGFKDTKDNCLEVDSILFSKCKGRLYLPDHILQRVKADFEGARALAEEILKVDVGVSYQSLIQGDLKALDLMPWFKNLQKLIKNMKRLPVYINVGKAHCQISSQRGVDGKTSPKIVLQFLHFIVRHVVPGSLLGSKRNKMLFMRGVKRLVYGCRNQKIRLSLVLHGLRVSEVPWLIHDVPSNCLRLNLLSCTVKWMLLEMQSLVRGLWYVSDTSPKGGLVFYDKTVWINLRKKYIQEMILNKKLVLIQEGHSKVFAWGKLRFMSKPSGVRPITLVKIPEEKLFKDHMSDAKCLLNQLADLVGSVKAQFGSSIDVTLQKSLLEILNVHPNPVTRPSYYFVRVDIKDAFGSIDLYKMVGILQDIIKFAVPDNLQVKVLHFNRVQGLYKKVIPFKVFETDKLKVRMKNGWIKLREEVRSIFPLLEFIKKMIVGIGVKDGTCVYQVKHGLVQGMELSAVLCELYYSWLDVINLPNFRNCCQDELFLRYCDDYLYLTPSRKRAERFLHTMEVGFPYFSCQINPEKTVSNLKDPYQLYVNFVGYSINLTTFCVEGNFGNFSDVNVGHTMNFSNCGKPGRRLRERMKIVLKLSPILVDRRLNSKHTSLLNIYQAALLLAFRFHAFIRFCFSPKRVNQTYLRSCVKMGVGRIARKARSFLSRIPGDWITSAEIQWLVFKAFRSRLVAVAAHYQKLIFWLNKNLEKLGKTLTGVQLKVLETVSTPGLPGPFATMK